MFCGLGRIGAVGALEASSEPGVGADESAAEDDFECIVRFVHTHLGGKRATYGPCQFAGRAGKLGLHVVA